MKILITGGEGFIGSHVQTALKNAGHEVSILSRRPSSPNAYYWNTKTNELDPKALEETEAIIHLAGAGLSNKRWTENRKKEIIESRSKSAALIFEKLKSTPNKVKTFISASAVGFYGNSGEEWMEENHSRGNDFLSITCKQWESSAKNFATLGMRVIILRLGIVLGKNGGALPVMAKPVKLFAGAQLGSGLQYLSWIHIDDLCNLFIYALKKETMHGTYNAVASNPVTNRQFTKTLGKVLHRPVWPFSVPAYLLKLLLGEMATMVLEGQRVSNKKILEEGFEFRFSEIEDALKDIYSK